MSECAQPTVVIESLPLTATTVDVTRLLHPLHVESVSITSQGGRGTASVRLISTEDVRRACQRTGLCIAGTAVQIRGVDTPTWASIAKTSRESNEHAMHRNLYVLNLPLDVSTQDMESLFSQFGCVVHSVILAMLDTQARRRGFIDMDAPHSAHAAVRALNGYVWHGYPLEVSYALVQRSGAPLDEGGNEISTPVLDIQGLRPAATIDADDVRALVEPHGNVADVALPSNLAGLSTYTARVTMTSVQEAREVYKALHDMDIHGQHLFIEHISHA